MATYERLESDLRDLVSWLLGSRLAGHELKAVHAAETIKRAIDALRAPIPGGEGVQCCMCGKTGLSTIEGDGGTECQLEDGRWTCSEPCWEKAGGYGPDLSPAEGEPVGWRETVTEIRDRCSRRPALSGVRTKDEILSRALSNSADLARIMDLCNALLRQRHAAPSNPVVSDEMVEMAARSLCVSIPLAMGDPAPDPDEIAFEGETEIGPIWTCYKAEARSAITAALSVKPQSGSDKP